MGTISSGVGLVSGINSSQIIEQLIQLDGRPARQLQTRIENNNRIKLAYTDLQARLSGVLNSANLLVRPSTFQSSSAVSSDTNTLGVTASPSAPPGVYQFTVARTVASQSMISGGFADSTTALVGAGTIKVGLGGGEVTGSPSLANLNGGTGVRRGTFRITDRSGSSSAIDIASAVSVDDVIRRINTASNLQVRASMGQDGLVLEDMSGGSGSLKVEDLQGGNAAADLGIRSTVTGTTLTGTSVNTIGRNTQLSSLNDGLGVRTKPGTDFRITTADGTTRDISLLNRRTVGEVIDAINTASAGKVTASLRPDGKGLRLVDTTSGSTTFAVTSLQGSQAAADLGLTATASAGTINGSPVIASLGSVLLKSLNGGQGLSFTAGSTLNITDRSGLGATVDLSSASSLNDVIEILNVSGVGIQASLNRSGTGIQLTDISGGTGNLVVAEDGPGTLAQQLGLRGTFSTSQAVVDGGPLNRQFVGENSLLADLNGGRGVAAGRFTLTNSSGQTADVDLTTLQNGKLGDVINAINAKNIGITASINSTGSGLLLTDTLGNPARLTVTDRTGSMARDLNIAGTSSGTGSSNTINGSYGDTLTITASDTLTTVVNKINNSKAGVTASIVNDGSGANPFRLVINANNTGLDGRFTFDAGTTGLGLNSLVRPQDAAVFLGGTSSGANPILITGSSNTLANVVPGVSLNLLGVSDRPVTVQVTQTPDAAVEQLKGFVKTFNDLSSKLKELTRFDSTTNARGLLLGDATASQITDSLFQAVNANVRGAGRYSLFSQVGLTISDDNQLRFDESRFRSAYSTDPSSAQRLFTAFNTVTTTTTTPNSGGAPVVTTTTTPFGTDPVGSSSSTNSNGERVVTNVSLEGFGLATLLQRAVNRLIDPVDGSLIRQSKQIDTSNDLFNQRIQSINGNLASKKARLQKQFANMETVLASLQTQQSALGRIQNFNTSGTSR